MKLVLVIAISLFASALAVNFNKISTNLLPELESGPTDILIYMKEYLDFDNYTHNGKLLMKYDPDERAEIMMKKLIEITENTQQSIRKELSQTFKFNYESFWISNSLIIRNVSKDIIFQLSDREDIKEIVHEYKPKVDKSEELSKIPVSNETNSLNAEFNVRWVKAPEVWARGFKGKGIVVGVSDSGFIHTHPALVNSYRGNLGGGRFDHNYNWKGRGSVPTDTDGHGTHCSGTVSGGVDRQIGVAPEAKFIHCASLAGISTSSCLQWFFAPTRLDGSQADTSKRPHVTSHSYYSSSSYDREYTALIKAGVHVVVAAGNFGPGCGTVVTNTATQGQVVVGNLLKESNSINSGSSRGPSRVSGLMRPSVSAPGTSVVSASYKGGYTSMSGTSMACPNVAGGIALLWSAVPALVRNIEKTNEILFRTALKQSDTDCGSRGSPNFKFGYGTVNYAAAISNALSIYGGEKK